MFKISKRDAVLDHAPILGGFFIKKILIVFFLTYAGVFYAQETVPKKTPLKFGRDYISFRHADEDKYFQGWQNPRSFISRFYINYNFQLKDALISRNPAAQGNWNFQGISSLLNGRIATELFLIRMPWFALGMGAAIDIPLVGRSQPATLNVYGVLGQFAFFIDIYLPREWKLRVIPMFHESSHLADGYRGSAGDFGIISYEFISFEIYKRFRWFSFYGGLEITYAAPSERLLRLRIHTGADFRYPIWKMISFIMGFHLGVLYDEKNSRHPESEGWHPAINFAAGFEFDRLSMAFKISHERGYEAATYHRMQTKLGLEFSLLF